MRGGIRRIRDRGTRGGEELDGEGRERREYLGYGGRENV